MTTKREDLAWAAGLFDGEGHISCRDRTGAGHLPVYRSPRTLVITISQHHTGVLKRFQSIVELGTIYSLERVRPNGCTYVTHSWRTGKFESVQAVVSMLWPFLGLVKRRQATKALKLYHQIGGSMIDDRGQFDRKDD